MYVCANGINNGKYAYNNLQQFDATWYRKFSKSVHMATETWYMCERDVPAIGGNVQPELGANPAYCQSGERRCTAPEYAVVNFLQKELSAHDFLSFRSDFLDDKKGQRTGYATRYSETQSCGVIGSARPSNYVPNCALSAPGTARPTTTVDSTISSPWQAI